MGVRQTGLNSLIVECRLATAPKLTYTTATPPLAICKFRIAIPRNKNVDGEWQDDAFFRCVVVFGRAAEKCAELWKGAAVIVQGKLDPSEWVSQDGKQKSDSDITAYRVSLQEWPDDKDEEQQDEEDVPF